VGLLTQVLAIEILTAARALDLRAPLDSAPAIAAVRRRIREEVPGPGPDRHLAPEIAAVVAMVAAGSLRAAAESVTGPLR
jgi:histidine ammonia-lyase